MMHALSKIVWNRLMLMWQLGNRILTTGNLALVFLILVLNLLFAHGGKYRQIEAYMQNSTAFDCTVQYVQSIVGAATLCHKDSVCLAVYTSEEIDQESSFALCNCISEPRNTSLVYGKSNFI